MGEPYPALGQPVELRGLVRNAPVLAEGLVAEIVGHHQYDVRSSRLGERGGSPPRRDETRDAEHARGAHTEAHGETARAETGEAPGWQEATREPVGVG